MVLFYKQEVVVELLQTIPVRGKTGNLRKRISLDFSSENTLLCPLLRLIPGFHVEQRGFRKRWIGTSHSRKVNRIWITFVFPTNCKTKFCHMAAYTKTKSSKFVCTSKLFPMCLEYCFSFNNSTTKHVYMWFWNRAWTCFP